MPEKEIKKSYAERQLVIFKLGSEEFGVDINEVREIIKMEDITRIPNTESYIDGVINLRGKIIVVIDLAKKLNLTAKEHNKDTRVIVIEVGKSTIGMIVDGCNEVLRLSGDQIEVAPDIIKSKIQEDYLEGVGILKDRLIILLDLGKVLASSEMEKVANIGKQSGTGSAEASA
jgi:purine-binding chemotaxis protein CheW